MTLDPVLIPSAPETKGTHTRRSQELHGQDGVHLPNELITDVGRGLGNRTAELEVVGNIAIAIYAGAGNTTK